MIGRVQHVNTLKWSAGRRLWMPGVISLVIFAHYVLDRSAMYRVWIMGDSALHVSISAYFSFDSADIPRMVICETKVLPDEWSNIEILWAWWTARECRVPSVYAMYRYFVYRPGCQVGVKEPGDLTVKRVDGWKNGNLDNATMVNTIHKKLLVKFFPWSIMRKEKKKKKEADSKCEL